MSYLINIPILFSVFSGIAALASMACITLVRRGAKSDKELFDEDVIKETV